MKISAIVITYNEEKNIKNCLSSLSFCDEIILIDSYSTDKTVDIAKKYTYKIYYNTFYSYSEQKKIALTKTLNEWILWLDADEIISASLKNEIKNLDFQYDGYKIPRKNYFSGKWIKYCGWYPDYHIRLFNKNKLQFNDKILHEAVMPSNNIGILHNQIIHFTYRNVKHYINKSKKYTDFTAKENKLKNVNIIYFIFKLIFTIPVTFIRIYLLRRGFLSGYRGLVIACVSSYCNFLKYYKSIKSTQNLTI